MSKTRESPGPASRSLFQDLPDQHQPSSSRSRRRGSKHSAAVSLADWLQQASPDDLLQLQSLIDANGPVAVQPGRVIVRTLGEVAEWFGLELQTVKQWRVGPNGCPGEEGAYDVQAIARWRLARGNAAAGMTTAKAELEQQALRLNNARAELKLAKEAGELVTRVAAKSAIRGMFARLKAQLEQLPDALAPLVPTEVRTDFRRDCVDRVRIFLTQLANFRFERDVSGAETGPEEEPDP